MLGYSLEIVPELSVQAVLLRGRSAALDGDTRGHHAPSPRLHRATTLLMAQLGGNIRQRHSLPEIRVPFIQLW